MELVDWVKEGGIIKPRLPNGEEFCLAIKYDGRLLPTFEDAFIERMTELKEKFVSKEGDLLIYGYMKSGTHWLWEIIRMIVENDSSVSEKSSKMDSFLECIRIKDIEAISTPRILNTHIMPTGLPPAIFNNSRVVVPIRHPKDTAVSLYHHLAAEKKGTNLHCDWDTFIKHIWFDPNLAFYAPWAEFTSYVWKQCRVNENFYPIIYEQLLEDPIEMIRDLGKFLGHECLSEDRLLEIATATSFGNMKLKKTASEKPLEKTFHSGYSMFRKGVRGEWKEHFSKEQNEYFDQKMKELTEKDADLRQVMLFFEES